MVSVVDVDEELDVDDEELDDDEVVVAHGSGAQDPGPRSVPPSPAQAAADSRTQVNAPSVELGTQHCVRLATVVVVVELVVVELELLLVAVVVDVVVDVIMEVLVVAGAPLDEVVLPAGAVVVVTVVEVPPHGVAPLSPSRPVAQSTKAPIVEPTAAASPTVWQSPRVSSRWNPAASLPPHLAMHATIVGSSSVVFAVAAFALQRREQSAWRPASRNLPKVHLLGGPVSSSRARRSASWSASCCWSVTRSAYVAQPPRRSAFAQPRATSPPARVVQARSTVLPRATAFASHIASRLAARPTIFRLAAAQRCGIATTAAASDEHANIAPIAAIQTTVGRPRVISRLPEWLTDYRHFTCPA